MKRKRKRTTKAEQQRRLEQAASRVSAAVMVAMITDKEAHPKTELGDQIKSAVIGSMQAIAAVLFISTLRKDRAKHSKVLTAFVAKAMPYAIGEATRAADFVGRGRRR